MRVRSTVTVSVRVKTAVQAHTPVDLNFLFVWLSTDPPFTMTLTTALAMLHGSVASAQLIDPAQHRLPSTGIIEPQVGSTLLNHDRWLSRYYLVLDQGPPFWWWWLWVG